jgi:hypothetical protein
LRILVGDKRKTSRISSNARIIHKFHEIDIAGNRSASTVLRIPPPGTGTETFGQIRIRSGTKINVSDPDLNPELKLDPNKI